MAESSSASSSGKLPGRLVGTSLRPPELEREFRLARLHGDGRDAATVVGVLTAVTLPFLYNDLFFAGQSPFLPVLLAVRVLYVGTGVLVVVLGLRARRRDALDLAILLHLLVAALFTVVLQSTRPADYYLPALQNVIGALLAWAVIPNRFAFQALAGTFVTGACVAWIALFRVPPALPVALLLVLSLLTANLGGAFLSWRLHRSHRLEFLALREQQAALRRMAESEELFRTAFDNATVGRALADPSGVFLRVNDALCRFLGYTAPELLGRSFADVTDPVDRAVSQDVMSGLLAGRRGMPLEKRYLRKDGSTVWGEATVSLIHNPDGSPRFFVADVSSVDERRRAESALALSRSRHAELYEGLGDGVCSATLDGVLLDFNETYRRMLGYEAGELRGKCYQDLTPERWHAEEAMRISELIRDSRETVTYEKEYRRKDGTIFPVELRVFARRSGDAVENLWAVVRDISREKGLREQLAVASRLASMGTLVAGVAHEINNPLGGAMASHGFAQEEVASLRKALESGASIDRAALVRRAHDVEEALDDAQVGERRIAAIVKDLTLLGRADARRDRVSPRRAVEEAMNWVPPVLRANGDVSVDDPGAPDVIVAEGQFVQILVNLITNALRSAPPGRKVSVQVRVGPGTPGMTRIEVSDDGVGMTPEVRARMFDPFFTTRGVGQGMGLGLAICHAIVTAHGGTISATSAPGTGTTMRVELPAA